ncbi:hypothetical protein T02_9842 [Trichinella nativa]|uniref:Uncharacterized protein n=1 Tax=Trichinella nativa TaxID=6335 RepID=A0A0V1L1B1_9BILA|nr:hypothetical protein T02_9842 [Trichinella nativa]
MYELYIDTEENEILEIRCIAEDFIENQTDEKKVETVKNGSDTSVTICLPGYELPKFHGDVLEFTAFCEQFEDSMHSHQNISESAKFLHIRLSCGVSVLAALNGLSLTVVNYFAASEILKDCFGRRRRLMIALGKDFTSSRITAAEVMLELFEFTFLFVIRKKWEEEVFLDDAKNSDLAWFPSFLKKQVRNEHSFAGTQLLGHPRLAKAIKTHANAEKVITAAALEAKAESQSNSCAVCGGAHIILHRRKFFKRRPKNDGVYVKNEAFRCSKKKRCGKAAWNLKHHGLLHQSGTMGNLKPAMGGYTS